MRWVKKKTEAAKNVSEGKVENELRLQHSQMVGLFSPGDKAAINGGLAAKPNEDSLNQKTHSKMQLCLVPCPGEDETVTFKFSFTLIDIVNSYISYTLRVAIREKKRDYVGKILKRRAPPTPPVWETPVIKKKNGVYFSF